MIYIYDILLNFSDNIIYEFYEWSNADNIENIKRIKLVKIDQSDFDMFLNNKIRIDNDFLVKIFKTCDIYLSKGVETIDYGCLFSDGTRVMAIEFDSKGVSQCKSKLLLDEEEEIAVLASNLEFADIKYEIIKNTNKMRFLTRKELKVRKYLVNEIKDSYRRKNFNKLKYLYIEYFDDEECSPKKQVDSLINSMEDSLNDKHFELYELLRLSHKKKQV